MISLRSFACEQRKGTYLRRSADMKETTLFFPRHSTTVASLLLLPLSHPLQLSMPGLPEKPPCGSDNTIGQATVIRATIPGSTWKNDDPKSLEAFVEDFASKSNGEQATPTEPYSIFTNREKRWISSLASFGAMFSTLMGYVFFPAIVPMSRGLSVSVSFVNLTVTSYLVVAGIVPAFMGDLADKGGRRPAYILMFTLVQASNCYRSCLAIFVCGSVRYPGASELGFIPYAYLV